MAVTDEIVDFYSSILNGALGHYAGIAGAGAIDILVTPSVSKSKEEHKFLEPVEVKGGKLKTENLSADVEVLKNGFNHLTKSVADGLSYIFGRDEVIKKIRALYKDVAQERAQLIQDAKIVDGLPAFLKEEIWEEV